MNPAVEETRQQILNLLEVTRRETQLTLAGIDPEGVVHEDQVKWRVQDVLGHLGVWNGEAAKSLQAYAQGGEYLGISSEATYDEYNALAVHERQSWNFTQVWAEYEAASDQLILAVKTMPAENLHREMLYSWNERGTIQHLVEVMMKHEVEHREAIIAAQDRLQA